MRFDRKHALWTVLGLVLLGLTAAALLYRPNRPEEIAAPKTPGGDAVQVAGPAGASPTPALDDYGEVPRFSLTSQTRSTVRRTDLDGQVWIADFIFTSCKGTCPMMSAQMQRLDEQLAKERGLKLVSFTVDPDHDTPERLAQYGAQFGAVPDRWIFLTGDKTALRDLAQSGFKLPASDASPADVAQGQELIVHSTRFVLVDRAGHIRGYYDGLEPGAVDRLVQDARRLLGA